jgi:pseudaminic acid synthase
MKHPIYVAEISANHLKSLSRAHQLIDVAHRAGANAVKLQTYKPETMTLDLSRFSVSANHPLWGGTNLFELYKEAMTPWEWHEELFQHARDLNLDVFSSPFDVSAVDFLEKLNCSTYKIASLETGDLNLISYAASKGKRMIMSTGASTLGEIERAVAAAEKVRDKLTLLVCTSAYPADATDAHVNRISTLRERFGVEIGLSDHTLGIGVSIAAIALGATIIEKHLTLRRSDGGYDGPFSLEPQEFELLVKEGNRAYFSLGSQHWTIQESETESRRLRRSLHITDFVKKGDVATHDNIRALRPNTGGPISEIGRIIGRRFKSDFKPGDPAHVDCVE